MQQSLRLEDEHVVTMNGIYEPLGRAIRRSTDGKYTSIVNLNDKCVNLTELHDVMRKAIVCEEDVASDDSMSVSIDIVRSEEENDLPF